MESGEWRYGRADDAQADSGGDEGRAWLAGPSTSSSGAAPNLWGDDDDTGWNSSFAWLPPEQAAGGPEPDGTDPRDGGRHGEADRGRYGPPSKPDWRENAQASDAGPRPGMVPPAPALPTMPPAMAPGSRSGPPPGYGPPPGFGGPPGFRGAPGLGAPPALGPRPGPPAGPGSALSPVSPAAPGRRTGVDNRSRGTPTRRGRPITDDLGTSRRRRNQYGDEPAYGPVLGFTAGWYAIPALFYGIWLVTLNPDRQALIGRDFVSSLPWLIAAVVMSLAVATMLRWATVGWRTLTLSFAAAVIGAGVATIAHSLTL